MIEARHDRRLQEAAYEVQRDNRRQHYDRIDRQRLEVEKSGDDEPVALHRDRQSKPIDEERIGESEGCLEQFPLELQSVWDFSENMAHENIRDDLRVNRSDNGDVTASHDCNDDQNDKSNRRRNASRFQLRPVAKITLRKAGRNILKGSQKDRRGEESEAHPVLAEGQRRGDERRSAQPD